MQLVIFVTVSDDARPDELASALRIAGRTCADYVEILRCAPDVEAVAELGNAFKSYPGAAPWTEGTQPRIACARDLQLQRVA